MQINKKVLGPKSKENRGLRVGVGQHSRKVEDDDQVARGRPVEVPGARASAASSQTAVSGSCQHGFRDYV